MDYSEPNNQSTSKARRIWLIFLIVVSAILILGCGGLLLNAFMNPFSNWVVQETDFSTNQERLNHINHAMRINLPPTTTIISFHQEGFQDWTMDVQATIPQADFDRFIKSLPPLDQIQTNTLEGDVGPDWIRIEHDSGTDTVRINYIAP